MLTILAASVSATALPQGHPGGLEPKSAQKPSDGFIGIEIPKPKPEEDEGNKRKFRSLGLRPKSTKTSSMASTLSSLLNRPVYINIAIWEGFAA